jgi:predicted nucleotidyltransferase
VSHEIYIFGSITRGEVTSTSDTDILVIPLQNQTKKEYPSSWSYYTEETLQKMHKDGRLFSWHLFLDSKCIYTPREIPLFVEMDAPNSYDTMHEDIKDLKGLLEQSLMYLHDNTSNIIFEIGVIHTCLRDIAMSASWFLSDRPCFSIYAPYIISIPLPLNKDVYKKAISARHNSTRGINNHSNWEVVAEEILSAPINKWVKEIEESMNEFIS